MHDVEVMTNTPDPLIDLVCLPDDQVPPSSTLSTLTNLNSRDLYSDWHLKSQQLCNEISAAIRVNKAVIIWQVSAPEPAMLDLEYLKDHGRNPCTIDIAFGQGGLLLFLSNLDSGIINGWNQTTVDCPIGEKVHPDNFTIHSWALVHRPAYWTPPHYDSDGSVTFVQVETGEKKWGLWRPIDEDTITRTNLSNIALTLLDIYQNHNKIQENWHGEIVTLLPGDMLIQPPRQFYAVYTPVASFTTGGHFYNYEFMHLTELSHYIGHTQGKNLTNQVHKHSIETFQRMVINLPCISCCVSCNKYVATGTQKPKLKTNTAKLAHNIGNTIIKYFWIDLKAATKTYRKKETDGSNSQMHPGQLISREELLTCLKPFTTL
ncbi:hypothetical protein EDB19DRAFT_1827122 [Suillus lakei]|nr:hypothetical protein EDB19DRAFT_1827122 [Suillus lakei]